MHALNLPSQAVSKKDIHKKCTNVPLDVSSDKTPILVGANLPELHVSYDVIIGGTNIPIVILTKPGWTLLRRKANSNSNILSLNFINTRILLSLAQNFWDKESYSNLPEKDPNLFHKNDM